MTFRSLALSSIKGNWRAYSAFFLSSVFSVLVFYMYGAFIFHPDVVNGHIEQAQKVRKGMELCEYIIVVFSFFFVLYANSAFLKTRKKEFGLFTLFGMTRAQLRRMLMLESAVIALLAISVGIGAGILLSKLFFMALALLLSVDNPIRFAVPLKALLLTVIGYFMLFMVLSGISAYRSGRSEIVDLLKEANKPKTVPAFSIWLSILGIGSLVIGYTMATIMGMSTFLLLALPILGLVLIGTYFLFTQSSVAILRLIQRNLPFYYKRTNMIVFSQMAFKMKDNARVLFLVSILSAVIMTASGTFYVFIEGSREQVMSHAPQTIGFVEQGRQSHDVIEPDKVKNIIAADGQKLQYELTVVGVPTTELAAAGNGKFRFKDAAFNAAVISIDDYNRAAELTGKQTVSVKAGHSFLVYPYIEMSDAPPYEGDAIQATVAGEKHTFQLDKPKYGAVVTPISTFTYVLVVDAAAYEHLLAKTPEQQQVVNYGFELVNWEQSLSTVQKIKAAIPDASREQAMTYRVESYLSVKETSALTLFIGLFVSLMFFIASGSTLYFKLYTEMREDEAQFRALLRIGLTARELRRIARAQIGLIFFVPVAVGILHTFFAMKALDNLMSTEIYLYAGIVVAIYIVMQSLFYFASYSAYTKRMLAIRM